MEELRIVGISGLPRGGKDTLAELFMGNGFCGVSLGDIVRDESRIRHAKEPDPISVANMTETANWLRAEHGPDFALREALNRYEDARERGEPHEGLVVFSVRAPIEVDFILRHGGELVWVEASDEVRYDRYLKHRRDGETPLSFEEMQAQESLQWQPQPDIPEEIQMNIAYVKSKATRILENNQNDLDVFQANARKLMTQIIGKGTA
jgi:dephospho-CoA kinase